MMNNSQVNDLHVRIIQETRVWYAIACDYFNIPEREIQIDFLLTGRTAGTANINQNRISYNSPIAQTQPEEFIKRTVPHEVAHLIQYTLYPHCKRHHGIEWESVMRKFNLPAVRCHSYDVPNHNGREYFKYTCSSACGTVFTLGKNLHNKLQKGESRRCRKCRTPLTLI